MSKKILSSINQISLMLMSVVGVAFADNPIFQTDFTADPAPMLVGDTVFVFTSHDEDYADYFQMNQWRVFSSTDMVNWTDRGIAMKNSEFAWASNNAAWASQAIERDGKYYFYVTTTDPKAGDARALGVGVSDRPEGPYKDAIGKPIAGPNWDYIDPTVFIDDNGDAYLYWGNPRLYYCKLKRSMTECDGQIVKTDVSAESAHNYTEGPWFYKREGIYYMLYASHGVPEKISYATSNSPTGPWEPRGIIMDPNNRENQVGQFAFTIHVGVIDLKGRSFFFYHNQDLRGAEGYTGGFTRSVAVEEFTYGNDGSIPLIKTTRLGVEKPIHNLNPYEITQAETKAFSEGLRMNIKNQQNIFVSGIDDGDYMKVRSIDFGEDGAETFIANVKGSSGSIEVRLDKKDGPLIATLNVKTGNDFEEISAPVQDALGVHDVYFVFKGNVRDMFEWDYWYFENSKTKIPQTPYLGNIAILPGKIEAEDFDKGGFNISYADNEIENLGGKYRDESVDIVALDSTDDTKGFAIGHTQNDEWLEYTIDVLESSSYYFKANVSSGLDVSSFVLMIDGKEVSNPIKIPQGENWDSYSLIDGKTDFIEKGEHILRVKWTGSYGNLDYLVFAQSLEEVDEILSLKKLLTPPQKLHLFEQSDKIQYFDLQGNRISKSKTKRPGVYLVKTPQGSFLKRVEK